MARSHCASVTEGNGEQVLFCKIHIWFNKISAVDQHVLFFVHVWVNSLLSLLFGDDLHHFFHNIDYTCHFAGCIWQEHLFFQTFSNHAVTYNGLLCTHNLPSEELICIFFFTELSFYASVFVIYKIIWRYFFMITVFPFSPGSNYILGALKMLTMSFKYVDKKYEERKLLHNERQPPM